MEVHPVKYILILSFFIFISCGSSRSEKTFLEQVEPVTKAVYEYEDIDKLIDFLGEGDLVLLGEASHGTKEFYKWRAHISKKLIWEHNFDFIAVESDWPSHYELNRYVKSLGNGMSMEELFQTFDRWPPWMWRNEVIVELSRWLKEYNTENTSSVGFYGMDMQAESKSFNIVKNFLESTDHKLAGKLLEDLLCLEPYFDDVRSYLRRVSIRGETCSEEIRNLYRQPMNNFVKDLSRDGEEVFNIERNIAVLKYGERRWRAHIDDALNSWNVRVNYMYETVEALREKYGENSRGIIWAHNTHVGDARATSMSKAGRVNIGQLKRESLGESRVRILGFGTGRGTVKAGRSWGDPGEIMTIPEPVSGSVENKISQLENEITLLKLYEIDQKAGPLFNSIGHRAMGVVYRPEREHLGNFVPTVLPKRYDAFLFFQETEALKEWKGTNE